MSMYLCMVITYSKSVNQPGKVVNPARGQLNRENDFFPVPVRACEFGLARRFRQFRPASACSSSPYSAGWIWCLLMGFISSSAAASNCLFKPAYAIRSVPSLSGHAIAYRWRSLPRVHRRRASKPQGSSKRMLPWQVTMDQLIRASLSHTPYRLAFPHPLSPRFPTPMTINNNSRFPSSTPLRS